jgi:hypothetical protein
MMYNFLSQGRPGMGGSVNPMEGVY